jgi:hypothetical protein
MASSRHLFHPSQTSLTTPTAYLRHWAAAYADRHSRPALLKHLGAATAGFVAVADFPFTQFVPELCELYPDARVVMCTRPAARWWPSFERLLQLAKPWWAAALLAPAPGLRWLPYLIRMGEVRSEEIGTAPANRSLLERHEAWVRRAVPEDRLLVMDIAEGWEPLCQFLGRKVPEGKFPKVNDGSELEEVVKRVVRTCLLVWACILGAIGGMGWGLMLLTR